MKWSFRKHLLPAFVLLLLCGCTAGEQQKSVSSNGILRARAFNSGFKDAVETYNGMLAASDGKVYYVLSSQLHDVSGRMYSYDPATDKIELLGDLGEASGEKGMKVIAQGKIHANFVESNGKLYFATHIGYFERGERAGTAAAAGYQPYRGAHFLAYDMTTGKFEDFGVTPNGEGIITMTMDTERGRLYGLSWRSGSFLHYDLATKEFKNLGPVSEQGEAGTGESFRTIARSMTVDLDTGSVYISTADGWILRYSYDRDLLERVEGEDLKKDYFGTYDPSSSGSMGYNWRQSVWDPARKLIYAMHGNSGYLFSFDPRRSRVEVLRRLTSEPSQRSGMNDQFSYGYLGFTLGPDGRTLYYLTGGPIYVDGKRVSGLSSITKGGVKGEENLHLVTYDIPTGKYTDHGKVLYEDDQRPTYVNSIAVGKDGTVYTMAKITEDGHTRSDLIRIPGPIRP